MRPGVAGFAVLGLLGAALCPAAERTARQNYDALNALRPDPSSVYRVKPDDRIELHRSDVRLAFEEGKLAFFAPTEGRITGVVFSGRGHILALPREIVEKQQMGQFLGSPVLDQEFITAYLRFTDDAARELLHQLQEAHRNAETDPGFITQWDPLVARVNPPHSLRLLFDSMSREPRPYFCATLDGVTTGPFDFLLDYSRPEALLLGQVRKNAGRTFYDVWASYEPPGATPPAPSFRALRYTIDTTLLPNNSLEGTATLRVRAESSADDHVLVLQLSRSLSVERISDEVGRELESFQNEGLNAQERTARGNDFLYVALPEAPKQGQAFTLKIRYHGNVIENAGNGVLFVGAHESWYPHLGDTADFADYDLTVRWPRKLRLVATGVKVEEHEEGDFRVGHWQTEKPVSVVGFNLGEYASASFAAKRYTVDVYANRQLEQSLNHRLAADDVLPNPMAPVPLPGMQGRGAYPGASLPPPSPAEALKQLGKEIDSSVRFYESLSGPFPFHTLSVSQIPGTTAQGWPGLLYIPTFSYLPPEAQRRAGLTASGQEHFSDLAPFHEVAHQWWGNIVGWSSYRDQWIDEAIANYLALLFADSQKNPEHTLRVWLTRFRQALLTKVPDSDQAPADIGALTLGTRLVSSKWPDAYEPIVYDKGAWVIHMIRQILREPGSKNPDARFAGLLQTLQAKYAYRALSTADLQKEVEAVMTKSMDLEGGRSMDWFFEEWVHGTGIPHYRVEFTAHPAENGVVVRGRLLQSGVPHSFIAPVPIYGSFGTGRNVYLGTVTTQGQETPFRFTTTGVPRKLLVDPQMTLLCVSE